MRERSSHVPTVFESLEQGSRARVAQIETFRRTQLDLVTDGLVVIPQERPHGLRVPKAILPVAATLGLLVGAACSRERGMEFPVNTPATTAPGEVPVAPTPQVRETPRPVQPTPTQEHKERESLEQIVLLPVRIEEGNTSDLMLPPNQRKKRPEPGWKYVYVEYAVENRSNNVSLIRLTRQAVGSSVLRTKEGFEYRAHDLATYFSWNEPILHSFPPGFRALGVVNGYLDYMYAHPSLDKREVYTNKVIFKVGEQTTPHKLIIPPAPNPPIRDVVLPPVVVFPEIDLTRGAVAVESPGFPTSRPDSEFKNLGTTMSVPGKGSITIEGIEDRVYVGPTLSDTMWMKGAKTRIKIRFQNESKGYGQAFNLTMKLFGEDGILYTALSNRAIEKFPRQPMYWDGYFVTSGEVGPGSDEIGFAEIATSSTLRGGKLVVSGDVNGIFNIQLPEPQLPRGVRRFAD